MKKTPERAAADLAREKYWNEDYVAYWKARVEEANNPELQTSRMVAGDAKTTPDDTYLRAVSLLRIGSGEDVLELGCGFGRSLPLLSGVARRVAATDISAQMIEMARARYSAPNVSFHVSPSEALPFPAASFDVVVCFAAFDAMYQAEALMEMSRVCRIGARLLITGKNDNYHHDDRAALEAEMGARAKGHPNYFTDVAAVLENLPALGFSLDTQEYFARRGDFARGVGCAGPPQRFYEFLWVLRKVGPLTLTAPPAIAAECSRTFRSVTPGSEQS